MTQTNLKTRAEALAELVCEIIVKNLTGKERMGYRLETIIEQALIDTHNESINAAANKFKGDLMAGDAIADEILTLKVTK